MTRQHLTPERRSEILLGNITPHDCAVIALQAVSGLHRAEAERLAIECGYNPDEGAYRDVLPKALHKLGYLLRAVPIDRGETAATFALNHEHGKYLVYVDAHVMGLVDGDLHNSITFWSRPVVLAVEVGTLEVKVRR